MLEDVEHTAIKNLEDDYGSFIKESQHLLLTKAVASLAAGIAAKKIAEQFKQTKGFAGLIGTAVGAGTGAGSVFPDET